MGLPGHGDRTSGESLAKRKFGYAKGLLDAGEPQSRTNLASSVTIQDPTKPTGHLQVYDEQSVPKT